MENTKKISTFSLFCVLIIAAVYNFESAAINPALATIISAFPNENITKVTFISTVPFITSMIFSVVSGKLTEKLDKKKIAIFALALYAITGMMPAFLSNINIILLMRLLTGVGVGLCLPIPAMIIAEYFVGPKREKVMGYMNAVFNVANGLISIGVGLLLGFGWKVSFYSFAAIFVIMLLVVIGCPSSTPNTELGTRGKTQINMPIPMYAYKMFGCMTFLWICFGWMILTLATFNAERGIVPMTIIGIMCALPGTLNAVAALVYPYICKYKYAFITFSLAVLATGFVFMANAHSSTFLVLGCVFIGFGHGLLIPYITTCTATNVPLETRDRSLGLVQSGIHVGLLLATFLVTWVLNMAVGEPYYFTYNVAVIIIFALAAAFLIAAIVTKGKATKVEITNGE
ncbi:MFS transporter [Clostridium sp. PL3]|uniref:MFS transporter n=1 Tax=Clostridium thailandense TaxID=2794346 RepID=A0A949TUS1_9CLOT|nr:MFS transporter [Clostridium thailandense]MBV7276857.1 MFS transporter [Clostridium thailandense]